MKAGDVSFKELSKQSRGLVDRRDFEQSTKVMECLRSLHDRRKNKKRKDAKGQTTGEEF